MIDRYLKCYIIALGIILHFLDPPDHPSSTFFINAKGVSCVTITGLRILWEMTE